MRVVVSRAELGSARSDLAGPVGVAAPIGLAAPIGVAAPIGFVPTMGALHAGHAALLRAAREQCTAVIASIFVNPTQFGPREDLARYPRSLEADLALCEESGVDLVWTPELADVYPNGEPRVTIGPGPLGDVLEGATRPTHFAGVLSVVAKYLNLLRPDRAYFGEKDYQQLTLIRAMVADLEFGATIVGVPTVREPDGLALSSRNTYLSAAERDAALRVSRALLAGRDAAPGGADAILAAADEVLAAERGVSVDYLELRGADLGPAPTRGEARLLVAARVGATRLIDNMEITL